MGKFEENLNILSCFSNQSHSLLLLSSSMVSGEIPFEIIIKSTLNRLEINLESTQNQLGINMESTQK